jgi:hypothetical protein
VAERADFRAPLLLLDCWALLLLLRGGICSWRALAVLALAAVYTAVLYCILCPVRRGVLCVLVLAAGWPACGLTYYTYPYT